MLKSDLTREPIILITLSKDITLHQFNLLQFKNLFTDEIDFFFFTRGLELDID